MPVSLQSVRFKHGALRPWGGYAITVLALLLLIPAFSTPVPVVSRIDEIIDSGDARSAFWGIFIQDLNTGRVLYSRNAEKAMLPASNQKIITTAIALDALGKDFRYQTKLYFAGSVEGSVMKGDLIIEGSGDPTFGSTELGREDPLRSWARSLAGMGVKRIEGRIIGDDDTFDDRPYAEGWDIDYVVSQASRKLGVSASGLSYRDNVIELNIQSSGVGARPSITMIPDDYLEVRNLAATSSRRRGWSLDVNRTLGTESVTIDGSVPRSYRSTINLPVTNPTAFTLHSFIQHLRQAGIEVEARLADIDDIRNLERIPDYDKAKVLFVYASPPLSEIITVLNKESNNFYAEQIFRTVSWGGSASGGERRIKEFFNRAGIDAENLSVRDGSGLSRKDMITPEALGKLLSYMYRHPEREAFVQSLARGGEARTTLSHRLQDLPVSAKTGSLEFVRTLSGYATTTDGDRVAFVIFANNYSIPSYRITQTIDLIIANITSSKPG